MLERVGTVEAELVQLQGAIRDHSNESTKVGIYLTVLPAFVTEVLRRVVSNNKLNFNYFL